jgi:alkaline phosphatase D
MALLVVAAIVALCAAFETAAQRDAAFAATRVTRVAFGSCAKVGLHEDVFDAIREQQPQVFVLAGDAVYHDKKIGPIPGMFRPASLAEMRDNFMRRRQGPAFKRLAESAHVVAVWDDHDFGLNDAGGEFGLKEESRKLFLNFAEEPKDSARWQRKGLYTAHSFDGGRLKIVLLDVRYERVAGNSLGEEQWQWLERELAESTHEVLLLVSPIQVFAFDRPLQEKFSQSFAAYQRLAGLLAGVRGVVVLSGDVHMSSFLRSDCGLSYNVTEFTSSGLTHTVLDNAFTRLAAPFVHGWLRSRFEVGRTVTERSFGLVDIDWSTRRLNLTMVSAERRTGVQSVVLELDALRPGPHAVSFASCEVFSGARFTMHWSEVVRVGIFGSSLFGAALGVLMWCRCSRARRQHRAKGE